MNFPEISKDEALILYKKMLHDEGAVRVDKFYLNRGEELNTFLESHKEYDFMQFNEKYNIMGFLSLANNMYNEFSGTDNTKDDTELYNAFISACEEKLAENNVDFDAFGVTYYFELKHKPYTYVEVTQRTVSDKIKSELKSEFNRLRNYYTKE